MAVRCLDWLCQAALTNCDDDKVVQLLDTQTYFDMLDLPYPVNRSGVLERQHALYRRRAIRRIPRPHARPIIALARMFAGNWDAGAGH